MPRLLLWLERHPSTTSCMFQRQRAGSDTTAVGKWTQQPPDIWQHPQERLSKWNYSQLAWPQGHTTGTSGEADFPKYTNILTPPKMSLLYSKIQAINIKTSELLRSRVQFSVPVLMTYLVFFFCFFYIETPKRLRDVTIGPYLSLLFCCLQNAPNSWRKRNMQYFKAAT